MDLFFWFCGYFQQVEAPCLSFVFGNSGFSTVPAVTCAPKWVCEHIYLDTGVNKVQVACECMLICLKRQPGATSVHQLSSVLILPGREQSSQQNVWSFFKMVFIWFYIKGSDMHGHMQKTDLLLWCTTVTSCPIYSGAFQETPSQKCHLSLRNVNIWQTAWGPSRHILSTAVRWNHTLAFWPHRLNCSYMHAQRFL